MLRFIARRVLETIPVLFIIVTATFFMIRFVPGGPFTAEKAVTPEVMRNLERAYNLDKPLWQQYAGYLGKVIFHGDLGPSFKYPNRTVNEIIADKLPVSLELGAISLAIALAVGLPLGVLAAIRRNTWVDYLCSSVAMVGICVPTFVLGPLLVLVFAIHFGWFNASGWYSPIDRVLPSLTLGCVYAAYVARLTRGGMLEVLNQDYIRTARAKGVAEFPMECARPRGIKLFFFFAACAVVCRIIGTTPLYYYGPGVPLIFASWAFLAGAVGSLWYAKIRFHRRSLVMNHALRGGLLPVVSFLGPAIAGILTGSFVIETIFQIPGLGREFVNSAFNRDYTLVLGTVVLYAALLIGLNLLVDIAQVWLNPKLKFE